MYIQKNLNPANKQVGDCVIRAISIMTDMSWDCVYMGLCTEGYTMYDMPSSNAVWGAYLTDKGYKRYIIPNTCPNCYSVQQFCMDYPKGKYLLATGNHAVTVIDGDYYDSWDSGEEVPIYLYTKDAMNNELY